MILNSDHRREVRADTSLMPRLRAGCCANTTLMQICYTTDPLQSTEVAASG
jgi:hypothetical protein